MKNLNKKDYLYISISIIISIISISLIYYNNYLSYNVYPLNQEIQVIDYLRTLYYKNFLIFQDFTFNLSNGTSLYNLAGLGLLSPITLVSYVLPFLSIKTYLTIIVNIFNILNIILVYIFFKKKNTSTKTCLLLTIIFTTTGIMYSYFSNPLLPSYLTFLLLTFLGVDKVFEEKKGYILTIGVFLLTMTYYYLLLPSIISILIYSLYRYLEHMNTITIKSLLKRFISIIIPIIVALLCSSILILPIITNENNQLIIEYQNNYIFLLIISIILIISMITYIKKERAKLTLSLISSITLIISTIYNYNIIPFIPLYLIIISLFISFAFKKQLPIYLNKNIVLIPISLIFILSNLLINYTPSNIAFNDNTKTIYQELLNKITSKDKIERVYIEDNNYYYNNINYYSSSSITKQNNYLESLNKEVFLNNEDNNNLLYLMLNNNKYLISKNSSLHGYEKLYSLNEVNLYQNNNVYKIGFATSNVMSYEDFYKLDKYIKQETLLNVIVADTETKNNYVPTTKEITLPLDEIFNSENIYNYEKGVFVNAKEKTTIKYTLPKKYQNKILYISFKVQNSRDTQSITINNITKNLKYKKRNLDYMLASSTQEELIFTFTEGQYYLSDFKFYSLDYANIENASSKVDEFIIEPQNTKEDQIIGTIDVKEDGYFMITIPYTQGFTILLDNEKVTYEKVDEAYIGFPITEGIHSIEIKYTTPFKYIAYLLSILGLISFITITYFESKRKFN